MRKGKDHTMCLKPSKENKLLRKRRWVRLYHPAVLRVLLAEAAGCFLGLWVCTFRSKGRPLKYL